MEYLRNSIRDSTAVKSITKQQMITTFKGTHWVICIKFSNLMWCHVVINVLAS